MPDETPTPGVRVYLPDGMQSADFPTANDWNHHLDYGHLKVLGANGGPCAVFPAGQWVRVEYIGVSS